MARKKISEYSAKRILTKELGLPYQGISFSIDDDKKVLSALDSKQTYVVKVDEGIKKRMKQGLVALKVSSIDVEKQAKKLFAKGYRHVIIEPFLPHSQESEKYLSLSRTREGIEVLFSAKGGIAIEENQGSIKNILIPNSLLRHPERSVSEVEGSHATEQVEQKKLLDIFRGERSLHSFLSVGMTSEDFLQKLLTAFNAYHFSFLEINPLVVDGDHISLLDVAAEVGSAGLFFVHHGWTEEDFRAAQTREKTKEEKQIDALSEKSQASFSLEMLNPDGGIFMLLSGGGASIVLADEGYNLGYGKQLANYGEYSGNPNGEEVYLYTKNLVSLLLKSKAKKKVLVIAGGVANFSDVRITFSGVIKALQEVAGELHKQHIQVFVRRGGPHQEEGLAQMEAFLEKEKLLGFVGDQTTPLPDIIGKAIKTL